MKNPSDPPDPSNPPNSERHRIRPSGGYRKLRSFQAATIIYDATVAFCDRFIDKRSRTHDQMVQAARSCGKNIAEGSRAAATTSQTELRLVNVARASLEELLLDYEDFLRQRKLRAWSKSDPEALAVRAAGRSAIQEDRTDQSDPTGKLDRSDPAAHWQLYAKWLEREDPAVVANALICLIHQTNYLLDQQISALERAFVTDGGYSEQLATARITHRTQSQKNPSDSPNSSNPPNPPDSSHPSAKPPQAPNCPQCGKPLALRTARVGPRAGSQFWGCSGYPNCKGTRPLN